MPVEIYPTLDDRLLSMISCEMMATLRRYSGVLSRKGGTAFSDSGKTRAVGVGRLLCAVENRAQVKSEEGTDLEVTEDIIRADMSQLEFIAGVDPSPPQTRLRPTNAKQTGHSQRM